MMHSIRFQITAITIAAILTTVLVVFVASTPTIQADNDQRSVETMGLIAQNARMSIENYTKDVEQSVEIASNIAGDMLDPVTLAECGVIGPDAGKTERTAEQAAQLDASLAYYCNRLQNVFSSIASHTRGVITYYYCISPDISTTEHGFFYSRVGRTGFAEREPLDARELDPNDREHTTWYYTPIERGRPSWVGPYTAHFLDEMWVSSYLVPVYNAETLIGVLGMDIPVDAIVSYVRDIHVYDTGFAGLLDEEGRVIYHPELEFGSVLNPGVSPEIFQQSDSGDAIIRYNVNGQERQMSFTTLSNGMKLAVVAPTSEISASLTRLMRVILIIMLAVIAVFAVFTMIAMRYITRPLSQLTAASQRLAAGDYDVELDYAGKGEVGVLTNAFQTMSEQLKANIGDLNRKVHTDDMTGAPNQRYFFELAEAEKFRMIEDGKHPIMLYFNLLGMKNYNRQYGFDEGDKLIHEMANVLASHYGEQHIGRFGQDHFAATTDEERLEEKLSKVFHDCRNANGGKTLPVSVGIYQHSLEEVDVSIACDRAKYACDQRRGSYTSGFCYFDQDMLKQADLTRHIVSHFDQALEEKWVKVYYQPIVRAANGRVCDEEALSRWVDPVMGFLPPIDFIPTLESAGLIYRLDLYVLDEVLEKMRVQQEVGLTVVPHSINLSRSDFDACDIVEEIRKRVDDAKIARDRITIEITESIIGGDFDFMKEQIERFQSLGFSVWMDDFGTGYSSLDALQSIKFDVIKFDMSFMRKLDEGENGKIVLTELMKMATALGAETVCEGVETESQIRFLQEIGCSKLQGYYYCKPVTLEDILERYRMGTQIGFENQKEADYYEAIGKVNLYDLASITSETDSSFHNVFNTLPMAVVEIKGDKSEVVRTNQSYRDFMKDAFESGLDSGSSDADVDVSEPTFMKRVRECSVHGSRSFFDETLPDGSIAHFLVRRVQKNPVTNTTAMAIAVLSISEPNEGATYARIARALAIDYYNIYYVDLDTEDFIEYISRMGEEGIAVERRGTDFFAQSKRDVMKRMYEEDREAFIASFTKENVIRELDERGVFVATYRLIDYGEPMLVRMKITKMDSEGHSIIIGISIGEDQVQQSGTGV